MSVGGRKTAGEDEEDDEDIEPVEVDNVDELEPSIADVSEDEELSAVVPLDDSAAVEELALLDDEAMLEAEHSIVEDDGAFADDD